MNKNVTLHTQALASPTASPLASGILPRAAINATSVDHAPPIVHDVLRSPGQALDAGTRAFMEPRFGYDFSGVRVHTGPKAAESARAVDALAYTAGQDIVFGAGQYAPRAGSGQRLLAHELTHVVQQDPSRISARPERISSPNEPAEREAAMAAEAVPAGRTFHPALSAGPAVHRQPAPARPAPPAPARPAPPVTLAGLAATRDAFKNAGALDPANCAANLPAGLGVDGPMPGENGMEMIFRITGPIPAGTEFDITRTKATGTWERNAAGNWTRLGGDPAGSNDDHVDTDECLTPAGGRIFVIDTPGLPRLNPRGVHFPDGTVVGPAATAAVRKHTFAEWVIARNRPLGINWTRISNPLFTRWHSIVSLEQVGGVWQRVNTPNGDVNEIDLGAINTTGAIP